MIILGPKTAILGPQFCRILVLGPQNGENAYLAMKYPRASRALRRAPDPTLKRAHFTCMTLLRTIGNLSLSRSGLPPPPDQILDPPLGARHHMFRLNACVKMFIWGTHVLMTFYTTPGKQVSIFSEINFQG